MIFDVKVFECTLDVIWNFVSKMSSRVGSYRDADKSLARPGKKQARKNVIDARDFNNIEMKALKFFSLQGKTPKEIHAILAETLTCFFPGWAKDLSATF